MFETALIFVEDSGSTKIWIFCRELPDFLSISFFLAKSIAQSYQILTLDRFLHELSVGAIPRSKCVSLHEIFDIWTTKKWQKSRFGLSWLFLRFNISTTDFELVTKLGALKDFDESNNFLQLVSKYSKILRSYGEIGPPREKFGILKN